MGRGGVRWGGVGWGRVGVCVCVCSQASRSRATLSCDSSYYHIWAWRFGHVTSIISTNFHFLVSKRLHTKVG